MKTATERRATLSAEDLQGLVELAKGADSVELKATLPESDQRSAVAALRLDPLDAQIRQVFFFDTPNLALNRAGVVARARRIQGKGGDSVVKLRPVMPAELPAGLRAARGLGVEVDVMPGGFVCSASLKAKTEIHHAREVAAGTRAIRKLFSKAQREFFSAHAPEGIGLDDLSVLGPIFVLKLKFISEDFELPLVAELWLYPDNARILELSTKCLPGDAFAVAAKTKAYLATKGIDLSGEQQTKTKTALDYFSRQLAPPPVRPGVVS